MQGVFLQAQVDESQAEAAAAEALSLEGADDDSWLTVC
jgi:hypothetical protein